MSKYGIGIDTSCYTTSVAIINCDTLEIVDNYQVLLKVKKGNKGLRQSEAFYQHVQHLGAYFEKCSNEYFKNAAYIAVSTKPRNQVGSYMPVFTAGLNFAKTLSNLFDVPLIETDHQSGHLAAALYGTKLVPHKFLGLHLSGGTTEILSCQYKVNDDGLAYFESQIVGGTQDISVGQLVDRIGVSLGLQFPCGKEMETIQGETISSKNDKSSFPKIQKRAFFNLSGAENKVSHLIHENIASDQLIAGLFDYIGRQIVAGIEAVALEDDYDFLVLSGGVSANDKLTKHLADSFAGTLIRGQKRFCTDNALGVAYIPMMNKV
jgi:N6-L-threonylcarbamoyladenine synthase